VALLGTLVLLAVASHLGGSLTHGRGFLTRYAPAPARLWFSTEVRAEAIVPAHSRIPAFVEDVQPMLQRRCGACHGPEKQRGGLRLDGLEPLLRGGEDGAVLVPGNSQASPIVQRLLRPLGHEDHMPPATREQPAAAEIELLSKWIDSLASTQTNVIQSLAVP
jgi:hypothetical protein